MQQNGTMTTDGFREVFMQGPAYMAILRGPDHVFEAVNTACRRITGDRELEGRSLHDVFPEMAGRESIAIVDRAYRTGEPQTATRLPLHMRDGEGRLQQVYVDVLYQPLRDEHGEVDGVLAHAVDVTEQVVAEQRLKDSEQLIREFTENSAQVFWMVDSTTGAILYMSPAFEHVWGMKWEEFNANTAHADSPWSAWIERIHADDVEVFINGAMRQRAGHRVDMEYRFTRMDGAERTMRSLGYAVRDADGVIYRLAGISEDITEKRQAQRAHEEATARYEALLDAIPDPAWLKDSDSRFLAVNRAMARSAGLPRDQVVGRLEQEVFGEAETARYLEQDRYVLRSGESLRLEERALLNGVMREQETWKAPVRDANGRIVGTAGLSRDITLQKRTEAALRETMARLQTILDTAPVAMVALNLDREVVEWNRAAEQLFGYPAEDLIGQPYPLTGPVEGLQPEFMLERTLEGSPYSGVEVQRYTISGECVPLNLWSAVLRDQHGEVVGALAILADARDRKQLEEQLRQVQKLEAVGRLAGGVAHDFNNILTAVGGHAELLLQSVDERDPLREDLVEISRGVERAATLTRQLLAFSRKQVLQPRVLNLCELVADARNMLRRLIGEDVSLTVDCQPGLWSVRADPGQLEQVLLNLAVNARDAMPGGGALTLTAENVHAAPAASLEPEDFVMLCVADTGTGIDAQHMPHIFEPFYTSKPVGKGTGLGLSTVHGIVHQSGGHIRVSSQPGRGTVFCIYLPRVEAVPDQQPERVVAPARGGGETILLVEDEAAVRGLMQRVLTKKGYRVIGASNGGEALLLARQYGSAIDLMITDMIMPHMSGAQLAAHLREFRPDLRVLYVSGYTEEAISSRVDGPQVRHFLQKPFSPAALAQAVRDVIDGPADNGDALA